MCSTDIILSGIRITEATYTSFNNANDLVNKVVSGSNKLYIFQRLKLTFQSYDLVFRFLLMALFLSSLLNQIPRVKKSPLDNFTGKVPGL